MRWSIILVMSFVCIGCNSSRQCSVQNPGGMYYDNGCGCAQNGYGASSYAPDLYGSTSYDSSAANSIAYGSTVHDATDFAPSSVTAPATGGSVLARPVSGQTVMLPNAHGLTVPPAGYIWVMENGNWQMRPESSVPPPRT